MAVPTDEVRNRGLQALWAVVFLAGQLGGVAHSVAVSHVTCQAHGEIIHAATAAAPDAEPERSGVQSQSQRSHDHDVCKVALHRRESLVAQASAPAALRTPPAVARVAPPAVPLAPSGAAVFRVAPKNSPPV